MRHRGRAALQRRVMALKEERFSACAAQARKAPNFSAAFELFRRGILITGL